MSSNPHKMPPYKAIRNSYTETAINLLCALERYNKCGEGEAKLRDLHKKRAQGLMQQLVDSYLSDHHKDSLAEDDIAAIVTGIETIARIYNGSVSEDLRVFVNGFNRTDLHALNLAGVQQQTLFLR